MDGWVGGASVMHPLVQVIVVMVVVVLVAVWVCCGCQSSIYVIIVSATSNVPSPPGVWGAGKQGKLVLPVQ